ncbi:MAG: hypothetical protein HWE24_16695 [Oceanospirillaceae bacterium]|nr:hypothetical protein [Oceanospirillaceae bacterium]
MANKLYVFAIGGTGSRVLRSLTMLLASGVKLPGRFDTVVPIIIDPDSANGDLNRTTDLLLQYQRVKQQVGNESDFFNAKMKTLISLTEENVPPIADHFIFDIEGTTNESFEEFIGYQSLSDEDRALIDLLYTKAELRSSMSVGFKGKPNIGSVVLNQIIRSREYNEFADKFDEGDAIFVISSIFGGTGAAGFPLLLKNLRSENPNIPNSHLISNSKIGAISFLPYFKISPPEDSKKHTIDHTTFIGKAQAALSYYEHAIFKNKSLNAFYYLSDNSQNNYEHNDGKAEQRNNAHFLELAGALAILDFLEDEPQLVTKDKKALEATTKEFGIKNTTRDIDFDSLGIKTYKQIASNLTRLAIVEKFLRLALEENLDSQTAWVKDGEFNREEFFSQDFYQRNLRPFLDSFYEWIEEMKNNDVSFVAIQEPDSIDSLLNMVKGKKVKSKGLFGSKSASYEKFTKELNAALKGGLPEGAKEKKFVHLVDRASNVVVNKILK